MSFLLDREVTAFATGDAKVGDNELEVVVVPDEEDTVRLEMIDAASSMETREPGGGMF